MIELPKRSVTRFFIPLIDVLTLMFCIFLLMPVVKPVQEESGSSDTPRSENVPDRNQWARVRQEIFRLRQEKSQWQKVANLDKEQAALEKQLADLRSKKLNELQKQLAIRPIEIGDDGRLFFYDASRDKDRRTEVTAENVKQFIAAQRKQAGEYDLYFLLMYPRPPTGIPSFPLRSQREEYDRWFQGIAHGYDIR